MDVMIQDMKATRYAQLSSFVIVVFDHLITLDDEVSLIWYSAWSPGKILFLINRYFSLSTVIFNVYALFLAKKTDEFCFRMYQWQGWTGIIAFMIAEAILQLRIYALYSLNKRLLVVMLIFYFACSACTAWIVVVELSSISITGPILPQVAAPDGSTCLTQPLPRGIYRYWIPMLSYDCLLCVLVLFHGFRRFRSDSSIFRSGRRLVSNLIRDSVIYFLVIFITYLTCLLVWAFARKSFIEVPVGFSVTMSCVMANRVVLNCREISRNVTCTVMGTTGSRTMMVVDDVADADDDDGVTKEVDGRNSRREVLSVISEGTSRSVDGLLGMPTLDCQWP